jgi:3-dehydroquinate dehydratase-1
MKHMLVAGRRGRKKGGETPLIGAPLVARTQERLLAEVAGILVKKPDLVEWRADHFKAVADTVAVLDTARALRAACGTLPLVFTCRSSKEGGQRIALDDEQVVELYAAVATSRLVDFVDFELEHETRLVQRVREAAHANEVRLILSYHNFGYTPGIDFLVDRFLEAERQGADLAMVSVMPRDRADVLTLLAATARADDKAHIPLISMSVGPLGAVTRMVGGLFGSCLSYAVGETASAPGQIPIGDLVTVLDILRRSRGGEML